MKLIKLKIITCLVCYDHGYVINLYDHSKRTRCKCKRNERRSTFTKFTP